LTPQKGRERAGNPKKVFQYQIRKNGGSKAVERIEVDPDFVSISGVCGR
jgi:hypothetical protein